MTYSEAAELLNKNNLFPNYHLRNNIIEGLDINFSGPLTEDMVGKLKTILGDGFRVDAMPNQQYILITKIISANGL